jgi:HEPN domain-containing protein
MPAEESRYPSDWLRVAEKDLSRVACLLAAHDAEGAGFHLQQALEKMLKAYLLSRGWSLRRIHDLPTLLNDAVVFDPGLEPYRAACRTITGFYIAERYPLAEESPLTEADVRQTLDQVGGLIRKLRQDTAQQH